MAKKMKMEIEGMSCQHCVKHVTEALNDVSGTTNVEVNLEEKCAIFESTADADDLKAAVEEAGYDVMGIAAL